MRQVRDHHAGDSRLTVLLTGSDERWAAQLPRLLEPQGVITLFAFDVDEAVRTIESHAIHAAVVDLATPMRRFDDEVLEEAPAPIRHGASEAKRLVPAGLKLLRLIHRLDPAPPAVVVRGRLFDQRTDNRLLAEALKLHAFSVLDQPVQLEQLLDVLRRLLARFYDGHWPNP